MRTASIDITDAVHAISGRFHPPGEYHDKAFSVLRIETTQGIDLAIHFDSLAGLELFVRQVQRAEKQIRHKAEKENQ